MKKSDLITMWKLYRIVDKLGEELPEKVRKDLSEKAKDYVIDVTGTMELTPEEESGEGTLFT